MTKSPPVRRNFPGLNGLRAAGALAVLGTHVGFESGASLNSPFKGILSRLDIGVSVFFVISGFLLFYPFVTRWLTQGKQPDMRSYLWHRVLRIAPALWLAVIGAALFIEHTGVSWAVYLKNASLTHIYSGGNEVLGLTQMWSLATEVAFYLFLPVVATAMTRHAPSKAGVKFRLGLLLATPAIGAMYMAWTAIAVQGHKALWLPGYIGWFGLGMALALWHVARSSRILSPTWVDELAAHPSTVWGLALALYLIIASPIAGPYSLEPPTGGQAAVKSLLYAAFALLIVFPTTAAIGPTADPQLVRQLGGRVATFLGQISYGIFCYHLIVLRVVEETMGYTIFTGQFFTLLVPTLGGSIGVAAASYYLVERPIIRWGRRGERPVPRSAAYVAAAPTDTKMST